MGDASVPSFVSMPFEPLSPLKRCSRCKVEKARASLNFSKNRTKPDGMQDQCRTCQTEYQKLAYAKRCELALAGGKTDCRSPLKCCPTCKVEKLRDTDFAKNRARKDGRQATCKQCQRQGLKTARDLDSSFVQPTPEPPIAPAPAPAAFRLFDFTGQQDARFTVMYENALRIVKTYRDAWPAVEEITQGWGAPCSV